MSLDLDVIREDPEPADIPKLIVEVEQLRAETTEWSDIAYEMWALLCNSTNDAHSTPEQWQAARARLGDRFHAALAAREAS